MRKNGFGYPLDWLQVLSWVLFAIFAISFYFLYLPLCTVKLFSVSAVPYSISLGLVGYYAFRVMINNPGDPCLISSFKTQAKSRKYCTVCNSHVILTSKHCSLCEKCIFGFDHHCRTLNTCIGNSNYSEYFKLIISAQFLFVFQISTAIFLLFNNVFPRENFGFFCFVLIEIILLVVLFFLNGALIAFHIWLQVKGISTYEYILNRHQRSKTIVPVLDNKNGEAYVVNSPQSRDNSFISISKDAPTIN